MVNREISRMGDAETCQIKTNECLHGADGAGGDFNALRQHPRCFLVEEWIDRRVWLAGHRHLVVATAATDDIHRHAGAFENIRPSFG